jgi:hypothetical protein
MNEDFEKPIECAVCGRITFDQDAKVCGEGVRGTLIGAFSGEERAPVGCGWPLRDDPEAHASAYGFDALVEFRNGGLTSQKEMHRKGPAHRIRTAAKYEGGKVLALRPLTKTQWINAYGEGVM